MSEEEKAEIAEEHEELVEVAQEDAPEGTVFDADDKGKGCTEWIVHPHDRPPDGCGGAPDALHEGIVGECPMCDGHDVIADVGGVPYTQSDVRHSRDLQDEPPDDDGGVTVPVQLDKDEPGAVVGEVNVKQPDLTEIHLDDAVILGPGQVDDEHGADGDVPGAAVGDVQVKLHGLLMVWYDREPWSRR